MTNEDLGTLAAGALSALEVGGRSVRRYRPTVQSYTRIHVDDDIIELPGSAYDAAIAGLQHMLRAIKEDLAYDRHQVIPQGPAPQETGNPAE